MFARRVRGERLLGQLGDERRRALPIAIDPQGDLGKCGALARLSIASPDVRRMFTDLRTPTVRSIAPSDGPASGGTDATLACSFFVPVTAVTIGGVAAPFTAVDIVTLAVTVPAGTPGTADVVVRLAGGTAITLANAYGDMSPLPPRASGEVVAIPTQCRSRGVGDRGGEREVNVLPARLARSAAWPEPAISAGWIPHLAVSRATEPAGSAFMRR